VLFFGFPFKTYLAYNILPSTTVQACEESNLTHWPYVMGRYLDFSYKKVFGTIVPEVSSGLHVESFSSKSRKIVFRKYFRFALFKLC
jgi:hypothetical protein